MLRGFEFDGKSTWEGGPSMMPEAEKPIQAF